MAEIINYNPEDNPRLNEIYEILLVAGYFRIRIASLKAFDKIVGGLAWCITSSNFEIEVEYNDQMQIGQKIKISQKVCDSLKKMKCPYDLQPFQLQGLDVNNIFPIVQWLVKFVYETRFQRQKYDRQLSLLLGRPITNLDHIGNPQKIPNIPVKRSRINRAIQKTQAAHPLRVYSALLQYNDPTAMKMYNKLLNILANQKKKQKKKGQEQKNIASYLIEDENEATERKKEEMNQFSNVNKISLNKLEQIIVANREEFVKGVREEAQEENIESLRENLGIKNDQSNSVLQQRQSTLENRVNQQEKILKQAKITNDRYHQKIQTLQKQLQSYEVMQAQLNSELIKLQKKHDKAHRITSEQIAKNQEYIDYGQQIKEQLKNTQTKVNSRLEKLVERRQELKVKKSEFKKKAKSQIEQLHYEKSLVQASVPEIDESAFSEMMKEAQLKKSIYTKRFEQLTQVNQELAILQRKAEKYTSAPQVAQYHQRFIELFQCINVLIEEKRSYYSELTNLQAEKKTINNYLQIMNNMKDGYRGLKKKADLKDFTENAREIADAMQTNVNNSQITLGKIQGKRESVYGELMDLIKLEREYLTLLRELKLEYENVAKTIK